ncbi:MAG: hypothetical protein CVT99_15250 [Bacteroidetes bacterium HGW-Bacteroidetes-16]|jgi:hypothetical protein|nr:MAG: hypothetical protein CVT99_15250 [Bacteroidetes bacterium HGW-Bacteroidetes-16]
MKKKIYFALLVASLLLFPLISMAETTGPGNPPGEPGGGDVPIGGGAPIGGGSLVLMGMAAAYGVRKLYLIKQERLEE